MPRHANCRAIRPRLLLFAIACTLGCQVEDVGKPSSETVDRFETGLTLVAFTEQGELIDAVSIAEDAAITRVTIGLPDGLQRMRVAVLGDRVDSALPANTCFTTFSPDDGGLGEVRVHLEGGVAVRVDGNGAESPCQPSSTLLHEVGQYLDSGKTPGATTTIEEQ